MIGPRPIETVGNCQKSGISHVRGQAAARGFLPEADQLRLAQPAFQEGAGVETGGGMSLHIHKITAMRVGRAMPEMHEAGIVQGCRRLKAGDVAAEFGRCLVGAHDDGNGVPTHQRADPMLDHSVPRMRGLVFRANGVEVWRGGRKRHHDASTLGFRYQFPKQETAPIRTLEYQNRRQRFAPFCRFGRIVIAPYFHGPVFPGKW